MSRPVGHPALAPFGTTIFATMSALAAEHAAINLGQGFPDSDGPSEVLDAAVAAIRGGRNQYPPGPGVPELLAAIAAHQRRFYGLELDPASDVLVTVGATEAIAATILALVQPGDEVVTFEPYYDSYAASIALAGGVRRTSVLRFPDFAVDEASLRAAITPRTRMMLLNTPHNPTGKIFTRAELDLVCERRVSTGSWVLTDEVYEHLTYDGVRHLPLSTLPGMSERALDDLLGGQDVLDDRVEGGLGERSGHGGGGSPRGQAVPHLCSPAAGPSSPPSPRRSGSATRRTPRSNHGMRHRRDVLAECRAVGRRVGSRRARPAPTSSSRPTRRSARSTGDGRRAVSCTGGEVRRGAIRSRRSAAIRTTPGRWSGSRTASSTSVLVGGGAATARLAPLAIPVGAGTARGPRPVDPPDRPAEVPLGPHLPAGARLVHNAPSQARGAPVLARVGPCFA